MAESTRKTRMAIVEEVVAGTLLAPSSATDYLAVQDGLSLIEEPEIIENAELKSGLAPGKNILGLSSVSGEISHYCYHSGVEGVAPEMDLLLESVFGAKAVASTEYNTVAGSSAGTASVAAAVNVDVGEGATFQRGEMLLIKDSTNGYSIRPIDSISSDALTLGFNLSAAPASGVNLGKCVLFYPDDTLADVSLSVWDYRGNGAVAIGASGCKVTEMSMDVPTGEALNMNFTLAGLTLYWDPIEITSSTRFLDFTDDDGTFACSVAAGWYRDPHALASALTSAMNNANAGETHTVEYIDTTGRFNIKSTGTVLSLLFATGANTANTIATKIGFTVADETGTAATTGYTSDSAMVLSSPQTPTLDGQDLLIAKDNQVFIGNFYDNVCFCAHSITFSIAKEQVDVPCICAETGVSEKIPTSRVTTIEIVGTLSRYEADFFKRFRSNETTKFFYAFGPKSGGNYVAGKSGGVYAPKCSITALEVGDSDGIITINMTLQVFSETGEAEVFLGFV